MIAAPSPSAGIAATDTHLVIEGQASLHALATSRLVRQLAPPLATAAGLVAGPQLRRMGTIGGNILLDTRCLFYNQTAFWREALGYCLKKDGDVCHVIRAGKKCVAAHSADTPPVLMTLDAVATLVGPDGQRSVPVRDFFLADGIVNSRRAPDEIVTELRIPLASAERKQAYAKLRVRKSIDFPLLTVAIAADLDGDGTVRSIEGVVTALGSRPRVLTGWDDVAVGRRFDDQVVDELAERAHKQCHPLENMIVDHEWRRAMVPVYVRRALEKLGAA